MSYLKGTSGNDTIVGTARADVIDLLDGRDLGDGQGGNDTLKGGNGDDTLQGEPVPTSSSEGEATTPSSAAFVGSSMAQTTVSTVR